MKPHKPFDKFRNTPAKRRDRVPPLAKIIDERWERPEQRSTRPHQVESAVPNHIGEPDESATGGGQIHGVKPVLEALRAGTRSLERIIVAEGTHDNRFREIFELARAASVPVRRVAREALDRLAQAGSASTEHRAQDNGDDAPEHLAARKNQINHQGIIASIAAAHYHDTGELVDKLAARIGTGDEPLAVVLDGVEDPRNLGAIIRTIECAGAHGVFVPERRAAGLTETVAKTAAGALEYVPVARAVNTVALLEQLKERGIWTVGTTADAPVDYTQWDWRAPSALVLGGEGAGMRRLVRERCDALVRIPLRGRIESLNVSVAAGIVLYEALRQRTARERASYEE